MFLLCVHVGNLYTLVDCHFIFFYTPKYDSLVNNKDTLNFFRSIVVTQYLAVKKNSPMIHARYQTQAKSPRPEQTH